MLSGWMTQRGGLRDPVKKVDPDIIRGTRGQSRSLLNVYCALGHDPARYWMTRETRADLARCHGVTGLDGPHSLPDVPGAAVVWCVLIEPPDDLLPAVPLLCRWRENEPDSPAVPPPLLKLAGAIRRQMSSLVRGRQFGLTVGFADTDLSRFDDSAFTTDSGLLALAAGLMSAAVGVRIRNDVAFSAAWDFDTARWKRVDGVQQKVCSAAAFGIRRFLLPEENASAVTAPEGMTVSALPEPGAGEPVAGLASAVAVLARELLMPPTAIATDEELAAAGRYYGLLVGTDRNRAEDYFLDTIAPYVCARERGGLASDGQTGPGEASVLVTSYTGGYGQLGVTAGVIRPAKVLLLHNRALRPAQGFVERIRNLTEAEVLVECYDTSLEGTPERLAEDILNRLTRADAGRPVVFDLTPGRKMMTLAMFRAAQRAGGLACYLMSPGDRVDPTNMRLLLWKPDSAACATSAPCP